MIIVTGGSGKVGWAAVKHLMERGYKVASIDLARPQGMSNPPKATDPVFTRIDITDFGQVMSAFSGIDARIEEKVEGIVHLGAIASPGEAAHCSSFTRRRSCHGFMTLSQISRDPMIVIARANGTTK